MGSILSACFCGDDEVSVEGLHSNRDRKSRNRHPGQRSSRYPSTTSSTTTTAKQSSEANRFLLTLLQTTLDELKLSTSTRQADRIIKLRVESSYGTELLRKLFEEDLPLEFTNSALYQRIFAALTVFDTWAAIAQVYHGHEPGLKVDFEEQLCRKSVKPLEDNLASITFTAIRGHQICESVGRVENWIVLLATVDGGGLCLGYVTKQIPNPSSHVSYSGKGDVELTVMVHQEAYITAISSSMRMSTFTLKPLYYLQPTLKKLRTLSAVASSRKVLLEKLMKPCLEVCSTELASSLSGCVFADWQQLNTAQTVAVQASVKAVRTRPDTIKMVLIQGPPGTGKTFTLMQIIKNLVYNHKSQRTLGILVCTTTNGAVDEVGRRLQAVKAQWSHHLRREFRFVRVGIRSSVHEELTDHHLDSLVEESLEQKGLNRQKHWWTIQRQFLLEADVILSTLASCQSAALDMFRNPNGASFQCLIVDEAGQCTEPELIMPMVYPSIKKIILIGDHKQLPATIISPLANQLGLGRSLFERYFAFFNRLGSISPMVSMIEQFRMHPKICQFPSRHFYQGSLLTVPSASENGILQPYQVFDVVDSKEVIDPKTMSKANPKEAVLVVKLIHAICSTIHLSPQKTESSKPTLGVITFYQNQRQLIEQYLEQHENSAFAKQVEVNTVDSYQGQESDIIILSCVRAFEPEDEPNSIGFVRSQQRMNVALTRAKSALYVCMRAPTLMRSPAWSELIRNARNRQCFSQLQSTVSLDRLCKKIM